MADVATPSAATMSTIDAGSERSPKIQKSRPEKPDEQIYQDILTRAEKEHKSAQEKVVRFQNPLHWQSTTKSLNRQT